MDIEGHYYSVPYRLVKQQLDARITENTIPEEDDKFELSDPSLATSLTRTS
jgi:hypothetical protein